MTAARHTVLYDRDCGFCKWALGWILRWDRRRALAPVAIQSAAGAALLAPIPEGERLDSWHLVSPGGQTIRSAGAAAAPLARLLPGGAPLAVLFEAFPHRTERAYRWVAGNRDRLVRWLRIDASAVPPVEERALNPARARGPDAAD